MMVEISDVEKRVLTVAMGLICLQDLIMEESLDSDLVSQMEAQFEKSHDEFQTLFGQIDHADLVKRLASPLDPPASPAFIPDLKEALDL